jgi:SagB-type dehydrogenase family enzyme
LPSSTQISYPNLPDGELLGYLHQATQIDDTRDWKLDKEDSDTNAEKQLEDKYNFPFCTKVSTATKPIDWQSEELPLQALSNTILQRRSTRAYNGANLTLDELNAVLDFTYQPQHYFAQGLDSSPDYFDLNLIETFVAVSGVTNLEEGCYYYAPKAQELRQIRFKNFRKELHYLCLWQELGRDAAAVVFHTADLEKAVTKVGDRAYRYLHLDAGHLGQRMNLAAIHLGLGVSGIAGFFDDQVNEVLGIPDDEAVLYITTLGRPRRL